MAETLRHRELLICHCCAAKNVPGTVDSGVVLNTMYEWQRSREWHDKFCACFPVNVLFYIGAVKNDNVAVGSSRSCWRTNNCPWSSHKNHDVSRPSRPVRLSASVPPVLPDSSPRKVGPAVDEVDGPVDCSKWRLATAPGSACC